MALRLGFAPAHDLDDRPERRSLEVPLRRNRASHREALARRREYRYDATARRIEKLSPVGESWRYVWRGQDMADVLHRASPEAEAELLEGYVHEPGGTCPLLRQDETGVQYILPDQNDGPSEEVSAAGGALGWTSRKGTWAEGWRHHGHAGGEPFLGQWFDAESGLHYNRFRYYDPDTGRYLSPDPIGILGGLNEYLTVSNAAVTYDRYGLTCPPVPPGALPAQPPEADEKEVQDFIRKFKERYPGREYQSGHERTHSDGRAIEIDFETDNVIIEFKNNRGKGLTNQAIDRMDPGINPDGKVVIVVAGRSGTTDRISPHVAKSAGEEGALTASNSQSNDILDIIAPDP